MSFTEVVLILAIALVILGPERLPGLARSLGRALREFQRASREIRASLEVEEVRRTIRQRNGAEKPDSEPKGDGSRTGVGTVAWKDDADDLAEQKSELERAETERGTRKPADRRPAKAKTDSDSSKAVPDSNAHLNENKLDLTSRTDTPDEPVEKSEGEAEGAPATKTNGQ